MVDICFGWRSLLFCMILNIGSLMHLYDSVVAVFFVFHMI